MFPVRFFTLKEVYSKKSACAAIREKDEPAFSRWVPNLDASDFPYKIQTLPIATN